MSHTERETPSPTRPSDSETAGNGQEEKTGRGTATQQTTGRETTATLRAIFATPAVPQDDAAALSEEGDSSKTSEYGTDYTLPSPRLHQTLTRSEDGDSQDSNPTVDTGDEFLEIMLGLGLSTYNTYCIFEYSASR